MKKVRKSRTAKIRTKKRKPASAHPRRRTRTRISADASARDSNSYANDDVPLVHVRPPAGPNDPPWWLIDSAVLRDFLSDLANGMYHEAALKKYGIEWRKLSTFIVHDLTVKDLYLEAKTIGEQYRDMVRIERADRRAVHGWNEPVYQQGKMVGVIRRFSDRLMELQLKATDPRRYAERHEHTGASGGPIAIAQQITGGPARPATIEEWERQALAAKQRTAKKDGDDGKT
jgi:hypothetical protein